MDFTNTLLAYLSRCLVALFMVLLLAIMIEPRYSRKKTTAILSTSLVLIYIEHYAIYLLFGQEVLIDIYIYTCLLCDFILYNILSAKRNMRMVFSFFIAAIMDIWGLLLTHMISLFFVNMGIALFISRLLVFSLCIFIVWRYFKKPLKHLTKAATSGLGLWTLICTVIFLLISLISRLSERISTLICPIQNEFIYCSFMVIALLIYLSVFGYLYNKYQRYNVLQREELMKIQIGSLKLQLNSMEAAQKEARILRHDVRHYITQMQVLLEEGHVDTALECLSQYSDKLVNFRNTAHEIYTDNIVINATLQYFLSYAEHQGIATETHISLPKVLPIDEYEMAIFLSNALENACHACTDMPEDQTRSITVVCNAETSLFVHIKNTYYGEILLDENGLPTSDLKGHGIGTKSIHSFLDKYNGVYHYEVDKEFFSLQIMIPLPLPENSSMMEISEELLASD